MQTTARPWPTCLLAIVSVAVLYGCSTSTPGSAGPAATVLGGPDVLGGRDDVGARVEHAVKPGHLNQNADNNDCRRATDHHDGEWRGHLLGTHI